MTARFGVHCPGLLIPCYRRMKSGWPVILITAVEALALIITCGCAAHNPPIDSRDAFHDQRVSARICEPVANSLCVRVVLAADRAPQENVRVFVLSPDGKEIGAARTDQDGLAMLPVAPTSGGFVFAEIAPGLVTGFRMRPTSDQYLISSCGAGIP